uniref:Uncharacterized protein n=1 Tax=Naja naja TaxID=35670 RepID=A0A8C7DZR5_NAJNA
MNIIVINSNIIDTSSLGRTHRGRKISFSHTHKGIHTFPTFFLCFKFRIWRYSPSFQAAFELNTQNPFKTFCSKDKSKAKPVRQMIANRNKESCLIKDAFVNNNYWFHFPVSSYRPKFLPTSCACGMACGSWDIRQDSICHCQCANIDWTSARCCKIS